MTPKTANYNPLFSPLKTKAIAQRRGHQGWQQALVYCLLTLTGSFLLASRSAASDTALSPSWVSQVPAAGSSRILITQGSNFIAAAVERVGPAVVRIDASRTVTERRPSIFDDPFFREFLGTLAHQMPLLLGSSGVRDQAL